MRFYIKPAIKEETEDGRDWVWWNKEAFKQFKAVVKASFRPINGTSCNNHFPVSVYHLPSRYEFQDGIDIGFCSHKGKRWNLTIERTPGASITVFGFTEYGLRMTEVK